MGGQARAACRAASPRGLLPDGRQGLTGLGLRAAGGGDLCLVRFGLLLHVVPIFEGATAPRSLVGYGLLGLHAYWFRGWVRSYGRKRRADAAAAAGAGAGAGAVTVASP